MATSVNMALALFVIIGVVSISYAKITCKVGTGKTLADVKGCHVCVGIGAAKAAYAWAATCVAEKPKQGCGLSNEVYGLKVETCCCSSDGCNKDLATCTRRSGKNINDLQAIDLATRKSASIRAYGSFAIMAILVGVATFTAH